MSRNINADEVVITASAPVTLNIGHSAPQIRILPTAPNTPTQASIVSTATPSDTQEPSSEAPSTPNNEPTSSGARATTPLASQAGIPRIIVQGNHPVTVNIGSYHPTNVGRARVIPLEIPSPRRPQRPMGSDTRRLHPLAYAYLFDLFPSTPQSPIQKPRTGASVPAPTLDKLSKQQPTAQQGNRQVPRETTLEAAVASAFAAGLSAHPAIRVTNFKKIPLMIPHRLTSQSPVPEARTGVSSPTPNNLGADQPAAPQGNYQNHTEKAITEAVSAAASAIADMFSSDQALCTACARVIPLVIPRDPTSQNPIPESHTGAVAPTTAQQRNDQVTPEPASTEAVGADAEVSTDAALLSSELAQRATLSPPGHDGDLQKSSRPEDTQNTSQSA